ncbi:MAG: LCP family protein [Spirochaetes bacterium]|nr:LCP family protein [Spirochaetota bacterium]
MGKKPNQTSKGNFTGWIILSAIALMIGGAIFAGRFFKSEEKLKVSLKTGQNISFLVVANDEKKIVTGAAIVVFNPQTNRSATISLLPKTFLSYGKMESFTLEEALTKKISGEDLRLALSNLVGVKIDYYFFIDKNNFVRLIDMLGGVEIYSERIKVPEKNVYIPSGVTLMDGDKSAEYLSFIEDKNNDEEYNQLKRLNNYIRSFVKLKYDFLETFTDKNTSNYLFKTVDSNMSLHDFLIFFNEIKSRFYKNNVDFSRGMVNLILYCDKKEIPGYSYILQPKKSGNWIKSEVAEALQNIKKEYASEEEGKIVVEILNGTDIVGFAARTRRYLTTFGLDVLEAGNAQHENYENTVVIIRNSEQKASKLADLIQCKRIVKGEESKDKKIDVTLILGKDFNGKVVK